MKQNVRKKPIHQSKYSTLKAQQKYMKNLAQEVHKSSIAVQHINQYRKEEEQSSKNIEEVKNQLNYCISQIHSQNKKHKILKELISLLKGQMTKIQAKQTEEKQRQQRELDKIIKQLRDDIDKINHKKNQQVAKIAVLKQNANQSRSQRVVFSNLFKKIQRELKQSQQTYKSQLLRAQKNKIDLELSANRKPRLIKGSNSNQNLLTTKNQQPWLDGFQAELNVGQKLKKKNIDSEQRKQTAVSKNSRMESKRLSKYDSMNSRYLQVGEQNQTQNTHNKSHRSTRIGRLNSSKQNIQNYSVVTQQLTKFTQRIKNAIGCSTSKQIQSLANKIHKENCQLQQKIKGINEDIQKKQQNINKLSFKQHQMRIVQNQYFQYNSSYENIFLVDKSKARNSLQRQCLLTQSRVEALNKQNSARKNNMRTIWSKTQFLYQKNSNLFEQEDLQGLCYQFQELCSLFNVQIPSQGSLSDTKDNILYTSSIQMEQKSKILDEQLSKFWHSIQKDGNDEDIEQFFALRPNILSQWPENSQEIDNQKENIGINDQIKIKIRRQSTGQLNMILNRMDKFGQCEKFLDRQGFYGQYKKQIQRKIKSKTKKFS